MVALVSSAARPDRVLIRITAVHMGDWQDLSHSPWHRLDALAYGLILACWLNLQTHRRRLWRTAGYQPSDGEHGGPATVANQSAGKPKLTAQ